MKYAANNVAKGAAGITVLALLAIAANADSLQYSDISALEFDMGTAANAATEALTGAIVEAELEIDDGKAIWEFDIVGENLTTFTVCIDAQTGQLVSMKQTDSEQLPTDALGLAQAIDSIESIEAGTLIEAELELEDATWVWELESINSNDQENSYFIDAKTGAML